MRIMSIFIATSILLSACAGPEKPYVGKVKTRETYSAEINRSIYTQQDRYEAPSFSKKIQSPKKKEATKKTAPFQPKIKGEEKAKVSSEINQLPPFKAVETPSPQETVSEIQPVIKPTPSISQPLIKIPSSVTEIAEETTLTDISSPLVLEEETKIIASQSPSSVDLTEPAPDSIALVLAILDSDAQTLSSLIKIGGDVKAKTENGETFLFTAAKYATDPEIISILVTAGADINEQDKDGRTALMVGARYTTNPEVILKMLDLNADSSLKDNNGDSALEYARNNPSGQSVYDILKKHQKNPNLIKIGIILICIFVLILLWRRKKQE